MSAREVIDQIKHLSPTERVQVVHYVVENDYPVSASKAAVMTAAGGLPVIRAGAGVITSRLVRELESLTPDDAFGVLRKLLADPQSNEVKTCGNSRALREQIIPELVVGRTHAVIVFG